MVLRQLVTANPQQCRKIGVVRVLVTEVTYTLASLEQSLVRTNHDLLHSLMERFILLEHYEHRLKLQHQTLKTLQERVMQLPGDSIALTEALFKTKVVLPGDLP